MLNIVEKTALDLINNRIHIGDVVVYANGHLAKGRIVGIDKMNVTIETDGKSFFRKAKHVAVVKLL